jgi:hypothetical protein
LIPHISLIETDIGLASDAVQNHGNHQSLWARDQALVDALADLAGECQLPWGPGVFPAAVPRPPPAAQLPPAAQVLPAAQLPPVAVVVPVPGAGAGAGAGPAGPARARVPARAPTPPAEVEALALDLNLEWLHEGNGDEVREVEEEPIPGYYYEFGVPYGTGPVIPGGR